MDNIGITGCSEFTTERVIVDGLKPNQEVISWFPLDDIIDKIPHRTLMLVDVGYDKEMIAGWFMRPGIEDGAEEGDGIWWLEEPYGEEIPLEEVDAVAMIPMGLLHLLRDMQHPMKWS